MHNIELNNGVMIPGIGFGTYKTDYTTIKLAIIAVTDTLTLPPNMKMRNTLDMP